MFFKLSCLNPKALYTELANSGLDSNSSDTPCFILDLFSSLYFLSSFSNSASYLALICSNLDILLSQKDVSLFTKFPLSGLNPSPLELNSSNCFCLLSL